MNNMGLEGLNVRYKIVNPLDLKYDSLLRIPRPCFLIIYMKGENGKLYDDVLLVFLAQNSGWQEKL